MDIDKRLLAKFSKINWAFMNANSIRATRIVDNALVEQTSISCTTQSSFSFTRVEILHFNCYTQTFVIAPKT